MKKSLFLFSILSFIFLQLSLGGIANAAETRLKWKWAHIFPTDSDHQKRSEAIVKEINEKTKGRIEIKIFPAGQLGDWTEQYEQVMRGTIQMALVPVSTAYDPRLNFVYFPYLDIDYGAAKKTWSAPDGAYFQILNKLLSEQGIKILAIWPQGLSGIALNKIPSSPGDPNVAKGIKIRAPGVKAFELSALALGYIPTPIPLAETFTAIQTGVVDGESGGGPYQAWSQFRDVTKAWVQYNDYFETWTFSINLKLFNSLSKEDQKIIQDACIRQQSLRFDLCDKDDKLWMDKLAENNAKIIMLTPDELKACSAKVRKEAWPKLEDIIGKSLMDQIKKAAGVN